jgi:hypothetical protein
MTDACENDVTSSIPESMYGLEAVEKYATFGRFFSVK